jgi:hypothetical protein
MKSTLLVTAFALAAFALWTPASAQVIDDPLHSVVCGAGGTGCVNTDNGTFSPLSSSQNWGFEISPPNTSSGTLVLGVLVPTNTIDVNTFLLPTLTDNGGGPLTETLISRTTLLTSATSNVTSYLNLSGTFLPTTNFSNLSAGESTENPGFTGSFLAFTVSIPGITLDAQGSTTISNDFSFGSNLPDGTVIVGFFTYLDSNNVAQFVGTAASGDLVITPTSAVPEPATWGMMLLGFVGLAFAFRQRRRMAALAT